jgi:hypothetical protein
VENSSVFSHQNNRSFFYPSATANWHILKSLGIQSRTISFVKLRTAYGIVSTVPDPYLLSTYYSPGVFSDGWGSGLSAEGPLYGGGYEQSGTQGNRDLKPETKKEFEFGLDLRMLSDRISLSATYFANKVSDLIIPVAVAASTGFESKISNAAAMTNKGIELDFSAKVCDQPHLRWSIYGNWTRLRNIVTNLGGKDAVRIDGAGTVVKGYPLGIFYNNGFERSIEGDLVLNNGFPKAAVQKTVLGDPNPDWRAGLGSQIKWKKFALNILFEHSHGGDIYGGTRGALINFGTHADTDHEITIPAIDIGLYKNYGGSTVEEYGYPKNPDGSYTVRGYIHDFGGGPVLIDETWWTDLGGGFGAQQESFIESAEWTKLREVSVSYSLKTEAFQKRTKLASIDCSITGRNLLLWTAFKGNDPETNLAGPTNERGIDYFNNPATRSILFTIKINY